MSKKQSVRTMWDRTPMVIIQTNKAVRTQTWSLCIKSQDKETHLMQRVRTNKHSPTQELHRQVIAQIAPAGIRRASLQVPQQTEPVVPTWTAPSKNTRRVPTLVLFLFGMFLMVILILIGLQVIAWINEVSGHWHGGDGYVTVMDADVGHNGTSHFLAFYQNGAVVVVEFSSDYSTTHAYTIPVHPKGSDHHAVTLALQVNDGRRDLLITLDDGTESILYNTRDGFSVMQP